MGDAVNLDAIKADIQHEQGFYKRFRITLYVVFGLIIIGLIYFFAAPERIASQQASLDPAVTVASLQKLLKVFTVCIIAGGLALAAVYYWLYSHLAARINRYAPPYVQRIIPVDILRSLWAFGVFVGTIIGIFVTIEISSGYIQALLLSLSIYGFIFCAFVPMGIRYLYRHSIMTAYQGGLNKVDEEIQRRPTNPDLLLVKAPLLMEKGQLTEAETLFRQILAIKPRWSLLNVGPILNSLGVCLALQKRYEEAIEILEASIHVYPLFGHTYDSLATCYLEQGQYIVQALELAELASIHSDKKLNEALAMQQTTVARAHALLGHTEAANQILNTIQQSLDKITLRAAYAAEINRQMGYSYMALSQPDAARSHFSRAIQLDPDGLYGKLAQHDLETFST